MLVTNNKEPRYYGQWVTVCYPEEVGIARLQVKGLRILDSHTHTEDGFPIVFEHTDPIVVEKMLKILNEG